MEYLTLEQLYTDKRIKNASPNKLRDIINDPNNKYGLTVEFYVYDRLPGKWAIDKARLLYLKLHPKTKINFEIYKWK